jgi:hypothetical protein
MGDAYQKHAEVAVPLPHDLVKRIGGEFITQRATEVAAVAQSNWPEDMVELADGRMDDYLFRHADVQVSSFALPEWTIDALAEREFRAYVDSVQAGSGAQFSLLPPENATGNYVKVIQRVPVKILFDEALPADHVIGPGLSVTPMQAGYAEGWITGSSSMPYQRFQFDLGMPLLGVVPDEKTRKPECSCNWPKGWGDQARAERSVTMPTHWKKAEIIQPSLEERAVRSSQF